MNDELFELAVLASTRIEPKDVIGTKKEYRLHGALKYYFQPDDRFHEVKVGRYLCDATSEDGREIIEVQTRSINKMRAKISALTKSARLTVVYPIIASKRLIVTYADEGEASVRKSPKSGSIVDFFREIYPIRKELTRENLRFRIVYLNADEIRVYAGKKADRRPFQKPVSIERIPTALIDVLTLEKPSDYLRFIPDGMPDRFTSADLGRALSIPRADTGLILNPLVSLGLIHREGRTKEGYIYARGIGDDTSSI